MPWFLNIDARDDFAKVELKVGTILEAEPLEESEKLIKLKVDLGESGEAGPKTEEAVEGEVVEEEKKE